jgi:hypothetical protein
VSVIPVKLSPWLPWIGAVVVVGAIGATAGALGAFGTPAPAKASSAIVLGAGIDALDCPGGASVAQLQGGERVLALKRSDDSHYVQVRNPYDINQLVWLSAGIVSIDRHQPAIDTLEVAGCPKPTMALDPLPVAPVVPAAPAPGKSGHVTPPAPPKETVKPVIVKASANPTTIVNDSATTITVVATDNVGVTAVTATLSGAAGGSVVFHPVGGGFWQAPFSSSSTVPSSYGNILFTIYAHDAAGNLTAPAYVTVNRQYLG